MNIEEEEIEIDEEMNEIENEIEMFNSDNFKNRLIEFLYNDYDNIVKEFNISFENYKNFIDNNIDKLIKDAEYDEIKETLLMPLLTEWYNNMLAKRNNVEFGKEFEKEIINTIRNISLFIENHDINTLKGSFDNFTLDIIGIGGNSKVYNSIFKEFIIKITQCPLSTTKEACKRVNRGIVYSTSYSQNNIIYLSNYINENIIGFILNKLCSSTPNFSNCYGTVWEETKISSIYERLKMNLFTKEKIKNGKYLVLAVMQFLSALSIAQQTLKFTHYDSHLENILYEDSLNDTWNRMIYKINCSNIETFVINLKNPGFNIKISDFGLSRIDYNNTIYCGIESKTFSHCIDYLTLFGCLFYDGFTASNFNPSFKKQVDEMHELIETDPFLSDLARRNGFLKNSHIFYVIANPSIAKYGPESIDDRIDDIYDSYDFFRPCDDYVFKNQHRFKTPEQILHEFVILLNKQYPGEFISNTNNITPVCKQYDEKMQIPENVRINSISYKPLFCTIPYRISILDKSLKNEYVQYKKYKINNLKKPKTVLDNSNHIYNLILHVVKINLNRNVELISDCCGMDVVEYMKEKDRHGIAINGVFFNVTKDNYPMGMYKDKRNNKLLYDIPDIYKKYYYGIGIKNNKLVMHNLENKDDDYFAISGPVLIDKSKNFIFRGDIIENTEIDGLHIFKCIHKNSDLSINSPGQEYINDKGERVYTEKNFYNCNAINPGELSHIGNLNPRSILAYNKTENKLYFVVVEGRTSDSNGATIPTCAELIYRLDSDIDVAINLDGGCSSNIALKFPVIDPEHKETIYTVPFEQCPRPYVSGNLFAVLLKNEK